MEEDLEYEWARVGKTIKFTHQYSYSYNNFLNPNVPMSLCFRCGFVLALSGQKQS